MQKVTGPQRYVLVLLATVAAALTLNLLNSIFIDKDAMIRCDANDLTDRNYMAGCSAAYFGDYEHAALYFGLEPEANDHMVAAQVLLLGNSRLMWAFSTKATDKAFHDLDIRYYLLGFGANERVRFPSAIIRKYQLRPKAVIVNADPFFIDVTNPEYESIISNRVETRLPALFKKYFQRWLAGFCASGRQALLKTACNEAAIFRSDVDGRWELQQFSDKIDRFPIKANANLLVEHSDQFIDVARRFRDLLAIPSECVILTSVPSNLATENAARAVAAVLHFTYIAPGVDDLRTIDESHLAPESAERWSAAMIKDATAELRHCTE